jgi:hypothetical protein
VDVEAGRLTRSAAVVRLIGPPRPTADGRAPDRSRRVSLAADEVDGLVRRVADDLAVVPRPDLEGAPIVHRHEVPPGDDDPDVGHLARPLADRPADMLGHFQPGS